MATNTFLTAQAIAREALPILSNNLVMPTLVHQDLSGEFKKQGDTIQVEKPAVFVADEFGGTINLQNINPEPVLVKMDKIADVSVEVTAKQMALELRGFNEQVLAPALMAIAEKINNDGLAQYKNIANYIGTSGTTPSTIATFADARAMLNKNKVPLQSRSAIFNPDADAKFNTLAEIINAEKSGTTQALREGSIGRIQGLDNFMSQSIKTHTAGGYTALADVTATVDIANNATETATGRKYSVAALTSAAGAATNKLLKGDILLCDGKKYTVVEDTANAVAGVISSVKLYPALTANITSKAVTFPDVSSRAHVANLAFHKSAFTFVTRPLAPAQGVESYTTSINGINVRVTMFYDGTTKKQMMSVDVLYGFATLYPELATRILG